MSAIAVFDLGTNTFRWLAADHRGNELGRGREIVGLGRSLNKTGRFEAPEINDAQRVLTSWRPGAGVIPKVAACLATATHAFRAASNGHQIAQQLTLASGIPIHIVSPEREAALTFTGVTRSMTDNKPVAVLDIGGGSTELSWGLPGQLQNAISLPVGVVTLAASMREQLCDSITRAKAAVDHACWQVYNKSPSMMLQSLAGTTLLSTCGTSSALAMEFAGQSVYDSRSIDGRQISRQWLTSLVQHRAQWTAANWHKLAPVGDKRATLMGPGIGILLAFMEALAVPDWRNQEAGLLEGALWDFWNQQNSKAV